MERILISGGGTGGHIFPALSIANAIKRRHPQAEILFVGADNRMEMQRVPDAGYEIIGLPVAGFDRKRLWRNFGVLLKLWRSMRKARKIVRDFKPEIAIGVGGYASGPTLKAAQKAGVPTLLQEQNSYPGVTNKLLAKKAHAICAAYEGLDKYFPAEKITLTGNPVRADLAACSLSQAQAKEALGFDPNLPLALVVGGSLGARTINESIGRNLQAITANAQLLWQTGKNDAEKWSEMSKGFDRAKATVFIKDMATAYRAADIVVSRAGAGTISELELLGKPVILVPSPNVAEDHQRKNAMALVEKGAAIMIEDANAPVELPKAMAALLSDEKKRKSLSENIAKMALPDADEKIVDIIEEVILKSKKGGDK
ncbi:MAG: undecaprenyldiphospho-muramoylpentapeptide beta-N-acetylglucosaminyltransferase [Clostridium sp.]|nr:undecaprenyldiphospho-muramoylpentapeptide beta-N-acetylglucosaminyltransferase [Clostridium sp.]